MRGLRQGGWGVAIVVGLSLCPQLQAGEPPADTAPAAKTTDGGSWLGSWLGAKPKTSASKATASDKAKKDDGAATGKSGPLQDGTAERARAQATLLRRLAVCDQIRTIAARKQDDALMHQADTLDERAWEIYTRRVAHLPAGQAVTEPVSAKAKGK